TLKLFCMMNGNDGQGGDPQIDSTILNSFIDLHRSQLELSNIPEHYWPNIYHKLYNEIFDVGEYFQIVELQDDEDKTVGRELRVKDEHTILNKDDPYMIFVIDHAYTYRLDQIQKQLYQLPQLVDRLCRMMFIDIDEEHEKKIEKIIEEMWKLNHTYTFTTAGTMNIGKVSVNNQTQYDGELFIEPCQICIERRQHFTQTIEQETQYVKFTSSCLVQTDDIEIRESPSSSAEIQCTLYKDDVEKMIEQYCQTSQVAEALIKFLLQLSASLTERSSCLH
ncbi:unnamed protein product, partial [Didymodactylos carnosus]